MPEAPVLVIGATGRTGRLIVGRLHDRGVSVRALVRDAAKGEQLLPSEVPQLIADVRRVETLMAPMVGVGAVIIAASGSAERDNDAEIVDYQGTRNLIEQASAAGIELLVFISSIHASRPEHYQDVEPTSLGWKARAEEVIRGSGIPYCIIRSGWLTDGGGGEPLAVSQGDTAEGRISRADLADVCMQLLFLPEARGKTFEVIAAPTGQASSLTSAVTALTPDRAQQTPARASHSAALPTWQPGSGPSTQTNSILGCAHWAELRSPRTKAAEIDRTRSRFAEGIDGASRLAFGGHAWPGKPPSWDGAPVPREFACRYDSGSSRIPRVGKATGEAQMPLRTPLRCRGGRTRSMAAMLIGRSY